MDDYMQNLPSTEEGEVLFQKMLSADKFRKDLESRRQKFEFEEPVIKPQETPTPMQAPAKGLEHAERQAPRPSVTPVAQHDSVGCGQASAACAINATEGTNLSSEQFEQRHGFNLLGGLNAESKTHTWRDAGNFTPSLWTDIEKRANAGTPSLLGLNGPEFSPSGRGHIVSVVGVDGDKVSYADPADGTIKTTNKVNVEQAKGYPQGNFVFLGDRKEGTKGSAIKYEPKGSQQEALVGNIASDFGLDPELVFNQLHTESALDPHAVGQAGEVGVGQVMPSTLAELLPEMGKRGIIPPNTTHTEYGNNFALQAKVSAYYLNKQLEEQGSGPRALAAYNAGPGQLADVLAGKQELPPSTARYVGKIYNIPPEEALEHIKNGTEPKGAKLRMTGPSRMGGGHPGVAGLSYMSGNEKIADDYAQGKVDPLLKFVSQVAPDLAAEAFATLDQTAGVFSELVEGMDPEKWQQNYLANLQEKVRTNSLDFSSADYAKAWGGKLLHNSTLGLLEYAGVTETSPEDFAILEQAGKDPDSNVLARAFTNYGPAVLGDIFALVGGGGALKLAGKGLAKAGLRKTVKSQAKKMVTKGAAVDALSTPFGKLTTVSARRSLGGNIIGGLGSGMLYTIPASISEGMWGYNKALSMGATEDEAVSMGHAAAFTTQVTGTLASALLPLGATLAIGTGYGAAKAIGKYATPGGTAERLYEATAKHSFRAMDKASQLPIIGGMFKAFSELPEAARTNIKVNFKRMAKAMEADEVRALRSASLDQGIQSLEAGQAHARGLIEAQEQFVSGTKQTFEKLDGFEKELAQRADDLLKGATAPGAPLENAGLDSSHIPGLAAPQPTYDAAKAMQAVRARQGRTGLKDMFVGDGGQFSNQSLQESLESLAEQGMTKSDVNRIVGQRAEILGDLKARNIISEAEYKASMEGLSQVKDGINIPPPGEGVPKESAAIKRFFDADKESRKRVGDALNLLDSIPENATWAKIDGARNIIAQRKHEAFKKGFDGLGQTSATMYEYRRQLEGKLDPKEIASGLQVMPKHLENTKRELGSYIERQEKLKKHFTEQKKYLNDMTDEELALLPEETISFGDALSPGSEVELERVLSGQVGINHRLKSEHEIQELKNITSEYMTNTVEGMQLNIVDRYDKAYESTGAMLGKGAKALEELNPAIKDLKTALTRIGTPQAEINALESTVEDFGTQMVRDLNRLIRNAKTASRSETRGGGIEQILTQEAEQLQNVSSLLEGGSLEKALPIYQTMLQDKGMRHMLLEPVEASAKFQHVNSELASRMAAAKSEEDLIAISADLAQASQQASGGDLGSYFTQMEATGKDALGQLEKSLMHQTGSDVANAEVFINVLNKANAHKETGQGAADAISLHIKNTLGTGSGDGKALDSIISRVGRLIPGSSVSARRLKTEINVAMDSVFRGTDGEAFDRLVREGFKVGDEMSGALPEIAGMIAPINRVMKHVKMSAGGDDILALTPFVSGRASVEFPGVQKFVRDHNVQSPAHPVHLGATTLRRGEAGRPNSLRRFPNGVVGVIERRAGSKQVSAKTLQGRAFRAEEELARGYKLRTGRDMPKDYAQSILEDSRIDNKEWVKGLFASEAQTFNYTADEAIQKVYDLAYKQVGGEPGQYIGQFIKSVTDADSARHMFDILSKVPSPHDGIPYLVKKADYASPPKGTMTGGKNLKPAPYVPLDGGPEGTAIPIKHLRMAGVKEGADGILVHPELHDMLKQFYTKSEGKDLPGGLMDLIKHAKLAGSPFYFLHTMGGQLLKEANYSFGTAVGMMRAGRGALKSSHDVKAAALSSGLSFAKHDKMIGMQTHAVAKEAKSVLQNILPTASGFLKSIDAKVNAPIFEAIQEAQLGAWMYRTNEIFETVGQKLIKERGFTADQAMQASREQASRIVNKSFGSMNDTFMSDGGGKLFRKYSLASGLNGARLAHLTDGYYAARDAFLGKTGVNRTSFHTGTVDPVLKKNYHTQAAVALGISTTAGFAYANTLSYLINGESTAHNKPGKEDSIRIGDTYFKPALFGFDNMLRRMATTAPGAHQVTSTARSAAGDNRDLSASEQILGTAQGIGGLLHPAVQTGVDLLTNGGKTFDGTEIVPRGTGLGEGIVRTGAHLVDEHMPFISAMVGKDLLTGKPHRGVERFSELFGLGFTSVSPVGKEHSTYVKNAKKSYMAQPLEDVSRILTLAWRSDNATDREELRRKALEVVQRKIPVPTAHQEMLGEHLQIPPRTFHEMEARIKGVVGVDLVKTPAASRGYVADKIQQHNPSETTRKSFLGSKI